MALLVQLGLDVGIYAAVCQELGENQAGPEILDSKEPIVQHEEKVVDGGKDGADLLVCKPRVAIVECLAEVEAQISEEHHEADQ